MCSETGLFASGKKHEPVKRIIENKESKDEEVAGLRGTDLYDGNIESIPNSNAGLIKLSAAQLRAVLSKHQVFEVRSKKTYRKSRPLKAGYLEAAFSRERSCLLHIIETATKIWQTQEELNMKYIHHKRKFAIGPQVN